MKRSDILHSLKISHQDIVLEIGPGNMPFYRSDIYLERDLFGNIERAGDFHITKPCILGDAYRIPLKDKSIDYVFCSQVLEHSDNPEKMLNEIVRVGQKGYIETPNFYRELLFGWPFHKWVVEKEEPGKLVLYENKLPQYFGEFFHRLQAEEYIGNLLFALNFEKFNTIFEWESSIDYEIRSYEALLAKHARHGNEKFYINSRNRSTHLNYSGLLHLRLVVNCIPILRRSANFFLKLKKSYIKNLRKTGLRVDLKRVIGKMKCLSCGEQFEDYIGKEHVKCGSCSNFLTVKDHLLIIDNAYQ